MEYIYDEGFKNVQEFITHVTSAAFHYMANYMDICEIQKRDDSNKIASNLIKMIKYYMTLIRSTVSDMNSDTDLVNANNQLIEKNGILL